MTVRAGMLRPMANVLVAKRPCKARSLPLHDGARRHVEAHGERVGREEDLQSGQGCLSRCAEHGARMLRPMAKVLVAKRTCKVMSLILTVRACMLRPITNVSIAKRTCKASARQKCQS